MSIQWSWGLLYGVWGPVLVWEQKLVQVQMADQMRVQVQMEAQVQVQGLGLGVWVDLACETCLNSELKLAKKASLSQCSC
jgi:hypothetical protein